MSLTPTESQIATNCISKLQENNFKRMNSISKQFMWSSFYFSGGYDVDAITSPSNVLFQTNDPRFHSKNDYTKFASTSKSYQQYIYILSDGEVLNSSFDKTCDFLINHFNHGSVRSSLVKSDFLKWSRMLGGLVYLHKLPAFKKFMVDIYNFTSTDVDYFCNTPLDGDYQIDTNEYMDSMNKLKQLTGLTSSQMFNQHLGFYCKQSAFCSDELKKEYLSIKDEYNKAVKDLMNVLSQSPQLTMCLQSSIQGDVTVGEMEDSMVNVDIDQVMGCMSDIIQQLTPEESNEDRIQSVKNEFNEILSNVNSKIQILIIVLIVLFVLVLISFWLITSTRQHLKN